MTDFECWVAMLHCRCLAKYVHTCMHAYMCLRMYVCADNLYLQRHIYMLTSKYHPLFINYASAFPAKKSEKSRIDTQNPT